jgi:hypothetical protein
VTRERVPLDWAIWRRRWRRTLSAREEGTARLEEAVAAYRAALEVRTRERVPLDWATTQNNLGTALQTLGEQREDAAVLGDAVGSHALALAVFERTAPAYAAIARNNVRRDLRAMRERFGDAVAEACARRHGVESLL